MVRVSCLFKSGVSSVYEKAQSQKAVVVLVRCRCFHLLWLSVPKFCNSLQELPIIPPGLLQLSWLSSISCNIRKGACLYSTHSEALLIGKSLFWWVPAIFTVWQNCLNKSVFCMGNGRGMRNANMCPLRCSQRYLLLLLYTASGIFCFTRVHVKSFFNKVLYEIQTDLDETYIPQLSEVLSTATSLRFQWELWTYDTSKGYAPSLQTGQAEEHHTSVNVSISPLNYLLFNSEAFRAWVNVTTKK